MSRDTLVDPRPPYSVTYYLNGPLWCRLTKQDYYFGVNFDHFWSECHFLGSYGSSKNKLKSQTPTIISKFNQVKVAQILKQSVSISFVSFYSHQH